MNNLAKEEIDDLYEKIMKTIVGGKIFGIPVTDKNTKLLIVAAYLYGMYGEMDLLVDVPMEE